MIFATKPSRREIIWGGIYLALYVFIMPWLVPVLAILAGSAFDAVQINFIYFCVNFAATTVIFRKFLIRSLKDFLRVVFPTLWYAILGYLGSVMLGGIVAELCARVYPDFANVNDAAIGMMIRQNPPLMLIGAVVLAPVTEELLFRGLVFRSLYNKSPLLAHILSMAIFSAIHITGYIGVYDPALLILCFVQYLPAAYCLNFAYCHSGTIVSPILMHMLTNLVAMSAMSL